MPNKRKPSALALLKTARATEFDMVLEARGWDLLRDTLDDIEAIESPEIRAGYKLKLMEFKYPKIKPITLKETNPFADLTKEEMVLKLKNMLATLEASEQQAPNNRALPDIKHDADSDLPTDD
jgi:hypothetical protein